MFSYTFMVYAFLASLFIAVLCPLIGIFLVLRKHTFMGDTLSHASLAGVAISLALHTPPLVGAFVFTSLASVLIEALRAKFKANADLVLSVVLTLSVGIAITLISSNLVSGNAEIFLFGSILTISPTDLISIVALSIVGIITFFCKYQDLLYIIIDEDLAQVSGIRVKLINYVFSVFVSITIATSIKIVGMMVLGSLLTMPVATAMQFQQGFKKTLILSIIFSLVEVLGGLIFSYYFNLAPGGVIALFSVVILLLTLFATNLKKGKIL